MSAVGTLVSLLPRQLKSKELKAIVIRFFFLPLPSPALFCLSRLCMDPLLYIVTFRLVENSTHFHLFCSFNNLLRLSIKQKGKKKLSSIFPV
jgi:hypothetical protein